MDPEVLGQKLEEVADTLRGYLLVGDRANAMDPSFGFEEAKRVMRGVISDLDATMEGWED